VKRKFELDLALVGLSALLIACGTPASPPLAAHAAVTPTLTPAPVATSATPAPTPERVSYLEWGRSSVSALEITAKWTTLGMKVEAENATGTPIFGAQRQDILRVDGERVSVFTFASTAEAAGAMALIASGRTTVDFLHTPYWVRIANAIVLITTDSADAAARLIRALR
jgi:hypothetical protein